MSGTERCHSPHRHLPIEEPRSRLLMDRPSDMMDYAVGFEVKVHTSPGPKCGTFNSLWLKLIGSEGESPPVYVNEHLVPGSTRQVLVRSSSTLGRLLVIGLCLEIRPSFPNQAWHCAWVEVRTMTGEGKTEAPSEVQMFLCDRWLRPEDGFTKLRSDKLRLLMDETEEILRQERFKYLKNQQELIRWQKFVDGAPHCVTLSLPDLGPNLSYTHTSSAYSLHYFKGFESQMEPWRSFADLDAVFAQSGHKNSLAKFVRAHWKDDWYFGYQCLNGSNPLLLRQTRLLPPNLSVSSEMLQPFLPEGSSLEQELLKGSVYLLDYEILDGIPANVVNGKQTHISAPLCLLHLNQQGQLLPIAIQLQQKPGPQNPVFLPSDGAHDWLLAKIWVRSADFQYHQLASHFLRTHMMAELFCGATLRHLPHLHPLHQLLMPHVRTSLQINIQARASMLAVGGVFDKAIGSGLETLPVLLSRATERLSYRSLCVPDDLKDRGVDQLPQSYYAQDALRVWEALHKFVVGWVNLYYGGDDDVLQDCELQSWITDIHTHGLARGSGFPQTFHTRAEVSQFVTMIVFSCSALHAAVNFSQLDFSLWMPNGPPAMMRPPPQVKGSVTEDDILSFLPDMNATCRVLTSLTLLSQPALDFVPLCHYREVVFRQGAHRRLVEKVQADLKSVSNDIADRNSQLDLPYPYLCPGRIENSVSI